MRIEGSVFLFASVSAPLFLHVSLVRSQRETESKRERRDAHMLGV